MGYTTEFEGQVKVEPPLTLAEYNALKNFADERHEGDDYPSLYCQWVPTDDGTHIEWDGNEKFYEAGAWMEYIVQNFLQDHAVNGTILAEGEEEDDIWRIVVVDNVVRVQTATITFED